MAGVPGKHEDAGGNHYAEYFGKAVKEEVVVAACEIEHNKWEYKRQVDSILLEQGIAHNNAAIRAMV